MIRLENVSKTFTLHNQNSAVIQVMQGASFTVTAGECVALTGNSGAGKSTLMRMIYGNYLAASGAIWIGDTDVAKAQPREIIALRRETLGYVSQFLRVVPRVATVDVVAEPLLMTGTPFETAHAKARDLLTRLNIPQTLWDLSPMTFSGGEQQRVAVARALVHDPKLLLADEPSGNLDSQRSSELFDILQEVRRHSNVAMIVVTHATEWAAKADRALHLSDGAWRS